MIPGLSLPRLFDMITGMIFRTGIGFDAHRLVSNRRLVLGGVVIPHAKGLQGHSDADVLAHALMDALLGAAALGDIGGWFPDNDPVYRDADSLTLLATIRDRLRREGWSIANTDATVIAEAPKLAPFVPDMRSRLAGSLEIDADRVSVKATTVEGMGALGRREGIAAQAIATLYRERE